jgi:hypothetical protein
MILSPSSCPALNSAPITPTLYPLTPLLGIFSTDRRGPGFLTRRILLVASPRFLSGAGRHVIAMFQIGFLGPFYTANR